MAGVTGDIARADVEAIEDLIYQGAWLPDHGEADRLPETLAPDAVVYGLGPEPKDHAAFTEWARARAANTRRQTRHLISNVRLFALEDGRVRGTSSIAIWAIDGTDHAELSFLGDHEDIYTKAADGRWLIHERRLVRMVAAD